MRGGEVLILSSLGVREMEHSRGNGEGELYYSMGFRFGIEFGDNGGRLSVCIGSRKFMRASEGFD